MEVWGKVCTICCALNRYRAPCSTSSSSNCIFSKRLPCIHLPSQPLYGTVGICAHRWKDADIWDPYPTA